MKIRYLLVWLLCVPGSVFSATVFSAPLLSESRGTGFSGSESCVACHQPQANAWRESDHFKAMQPATTSSVLGNFDNAVVTFHGTQTRFIKRGDQFLIKTVGNDSEEHEFPVRYTFGVYPLQQYLVDIGAGHLQAFDIAWDARPREAGGGRWYHLQPDEKITPQDILFWQGHFQNWNSRCAECHSTNVAKAYTAATRSYATNWTDVNVGCEACHGPGEAHIALARVKGVKTGETGFSRAHTAPLRWRFDGSAAIATPSGNKSQTMIDTCGGCHSLRMPLAANGAGRPYSDAYAINFLDQAHYFADGQIREEVFVLGSFLQSKMYAAGVTCSNCHDPHSGSLLITGNGLCAQCHQPAVYDQPSHHGHRADSVGSACVECHMPSRTYMGVDDRRDHGFHIPDPVLSLQLGTPLACGQCHSGRSAAWFADTWLTGRAPGRPSNQTAVAMHGAAQGDATVVPVLLKQLASEQRPIVRGSLLAASSSILTPALLAVVARDIASADPLVRRGAAQALVGAPTQARLRMIASRLTEPSPSVRFALAQSLLEVLPYVPAGQQQVFDPLLADYRAMLLLHEDTPAAQMALAELAIGEGNPDAAESAYREALAIAPAFMPAMVNLADLYRALGRTQEAGSLLMRAVSLSPDSGLANHSYGLQLVRQQAYAGALPYLRRATQAPDANARFLYVYAVAQQTAGDLDGAIASLEESHRRWPNHVDVLEALVQYQLMKLQTLSRDSPDYAESARQVARVRKRLNEIRTALDAG